MKSILIVTTSYPGRSEEERIAGGFVPDFSRALVQLGLEVSVVAPALYEDTTVEDDIYVRRFSVPRLPLSLLSPLKVPDWKAIGSTLLTGRRAVLKACAHRRPDHILALWVLPSGDWAMRVGRHLDIPYSTWALGSDIWSLSRIPGVRQYLALVLRRASHRFADGFLLAEDVKSISRRSCSFLPTSRDFGPAGSRSMSTKPPYRLAFLGRWHPNKGVDLLLKALALLTDRDWSCIEAVRIHGGGPLKAQVLADVAALQDAGRAVNLGGYLDIEGALDLFGWTDYVLVPSRIESIPVVFSDAMQAKRPVIATPVGDLPRIVTNGRNGILATHLSSSAIADAIRRAVTGATHWSTRDIDASTFTPLSAARQFLNALGIDHGKASFG